MVQFYTQVLAISVGEWERCFATAVFWVTVFCVVAKEKAMNAIIHICVSVIVVVIISAITSASPPLPSHVRHNNVATTNMCRDSGLPATHQRGVARVGSGSTQKSPLGPNASLWGAECAAMCCSAGPTKCRFWSAAPGADGSGVCALLPRFVCVWLKMRSSSYSGPNALSMWYPD